MKEIKGLRQVKFGAILSYILIALNAVYGLFLTPYILSKLGNAEFGVYKTISSLSSSLMVLDLGLGGTVMRYVAKYKAEKDEKNLSNFLALIFLQCAIIIAVVMMICLGLYFCISGLYSQSLTIQEIQKAKKLFIVLSLSLGLHIFENVINGIITGNNDFIFGNGIKLIRLILRIALIYILLNIIRDSLILVLIDFFITLFFLMLEIIWAKFHLHAKVKFYFWDKLLFKESLFYSIFMFLTSIISQVNSNLDIVFIGILMSPNAVTVYSMGIVLFMMFNEISTSISGVMLPSVINVLKEENGLIKVKNIVVKAGRLQFALLGAFLMGFVVLGHDFINLWLGNGFEDVYLITIILMVPALFELCVNICLSILRAENLLAFRTLVLLGTTLLNAVITYFGVKYGGYFWACTGTAFSYIIGSLIIMNIYYYKKFNFNMIKIYAQIFHKIIICILVPSVIIYFTSKFLFGSWHKFLLNVLIYCIIYSIMLLLFGFSKEEKKELLGK